jgi:hypothetical protein
MADPYENESGITVGELMKALSLYPKDAPVCFGPHGHFTYFRVKDRGNIAQIEFNEADGQDYQLLPHHHYQQHLRKIGIR